MSGVRMRLTIMGCATRSASRTISDMAKRGLILKWPDGLYRLAVGEQLGLQTGEVDPFDCGDDEAEKQIPHIHSE